MTKTIDPADIESELGHIWESFQGTNKMRACLFNLIVYTQKGERTTYLNAVAQKVIEKFPSRIIFITHDSSCNSHDLRTRVSVLTADKGETEIACDLIEIDICSHLLPRVPFVILPHILPDLPVYLLHGDDPTEPSPIAEQLEHFASRIIFDSETTRDLPRFAQILLTYNKGGSADIADLNWARIEGWRLLFANVFKSPEELDHLRDTTTLNLHYNDKKTEYLSHTNIQAIYLQGWLAVQLGWTLTKIVKDRGIQTFSYERENAPLHISLHPSRMEGVPSGRILSIEIKTKRGHHYTFKRDKKCPHHVIIEKSSAASCALPVHYVLDKDVSGKSLVKEICHKGTSSHYTKMLALLGNINPGELHHE